MSSHSDSSDAEDDFYRSLSLSLSSRLQLNLSYSHDPDDDLRDQPLDVDHIASALEADDPVTQEELLRAIFQANVIPEAERDSFERLKPVSLRLSRLRDAYMKKQYMQAIQFLDNRTKIKVDSDLQVDPNDDRLLWSLNDHRLDYLLTVSSSIGLWAATPRIQSDHNFALNLDFHQPYRNFKGKYGKLGFDPKERMLYIGRSKNDEVWLAMAPWTFLDGMADDVPPGHLTGDTRMSTPHYRMLVMFFAYILSSLEDRPFTCDDPYGPSVFNSNPNLSLYTNIMYVSPHPSPPPLSIHT
jgi:hypothetical protein